jgi:hypothetical protein
MTIAWMTIMTHTGLEFTLLNYLGVLNFLEAPVLIVKMNIHNNSTYFIMFSVGSAFVRNFSIVPYTL